jgi:hypothetical protein
MLLALPRLLTSAATYATSGRTNIILTKQSKFKIFKLQSRTMSAASPFLQTLALSMTAADKAGEIIRAIMAGGNLDIVEKTGADDLQVLLNSELFGPGHFVGL